MEYLEIVELRERQKPQVAAYYKTRNTGTRNTGKTPDQWRNTGGTPEDWRSSGTLAKQSEYHRKEEQENTSIATEQQNNIKKYYQYRATSY